MFKANTITKLNFKNCFQKSFLSLREIYFREMSTSTRTLRSRTQVEKEASIPNSDLLDANPVNPPKKKSPRKRGKNEAEIQEEIKAGNSEDALSEAKQSKLELSEKSKSSSISPQKGRNKPNADIKIETNNMPGDIENAGWEPQNWRKVWENILEMRKLHVAPVDSLGCEECPEDGVTPEVRTERITSCFLPNV